MMGAVAERVRVRLGPMCHVAPAAELEAWMISAQPGERFTYARGQALAQGERTVIMARDYAQAGLVMTLQQVATDAAGRRETHWLVQRRSAAAAVVARDDAAGAAAGVAGDDGPEAEELDAILRAFARAANLRGVAPTNAELARLCAIRDGRRVRYLVGKLISRGRIRIQDNGPRARRIVTITATGKSTVAGRL